MKDEEEEDTIIEEVDSEKDEIEEAANDNYKKSLLSGW